MAGHRLLFVEDDQARRDALRKIFIQKGWDVVMTAPKGLAWLAPPPDCLINGPDPGEIETASLRAAPSTLCHVPRIVPARSPSETWADGGC